MEEEVERDDNLYDVTLDYLLHRKYPHGSTVQDKGIIRKIAKHYS